jgi:hypothetical protein
MKITFELDAGRASEDIMVLCGVMWCYVVLCGVMWCYMVLCGDIWCYVVRYLYHH